MCVILDILKGFIPVFLASRLLSFSCWWFAPVISAPVFGHAFSPFWKGKGGKAIAVSFGALLGLLPFYSIVFALATLYIVLSVGIVINPHRLRSIVTYILFAVYCIYACCIQGKLETSVFCGCLLIIKPTGAGGELFPMLVALLGGISAGGASTMLRLLGKYGVKKSLIVFVFSLFSLLTAAPFLIFDYHPMTMQQIAMLLLAGVSAALGQFSVTNAYAFAPAREISVFDYSQVVFSAILGFFLFQQIPDLYSLLGYLIVCGSAVGMFLRSNRKDAQTV